MRGGVDGRTLTRLFEGDDSCREPTTTKKKLSRCDESVGDVKTPGRFVHWVIPGIRACPRRRRLPDTFRGLFEMESVLEQADLRGD